MSFDKPWGNYLLAEIVETPAPDKISMWPETLGWQILAVLVIFKLAYNLYCTWKRYQRNVYRRDALRWLRHCQLNDVEQIRQIPTLLRKTALLAYSDPKLNATRTEIVTLSGNDWALWLDKHCPQTHFSKPVEHSKFPNLLSSLPYMRIVDINEPCFQTEIAMLINEVNCWLESHLDAEALIEQNNLVKQEKAPNSSSVTSAQP